MCVYTRSRSTVHNSPAHHINISLKIMCYQASTMIHQSSKARIRPSRRAVDIRWAHAWCWPGLMFPASSSAQCAIRRPPRELLQAGSIALIDSWSVWILVECFHHLVPESAHIWGHRKGKVLNRQWSACAVIRQIFTLNAGHRCLAAVVSKHYSDTLTQLNGGKHALLRYRYSPHSWIVEGCRAQTQQAQSTTCPAGKCA